MSSVGISILGDSISTLGGWVPKAWRTHYQGEVSIEGVTKPAETWWGQVVEGLGGHLVANASYSGSMVEGYGFPAGISEQRIEALAGEDGAEPDLVIVFMGINDYGWGSAFNQTMGHSVSASATVEQLGGQQPVASRLGDEALERFEESYRVMLLAIAKRFPQAKAWCVNLVPGCVNFTYCLRGIELDSYNAAIKRAALACGAQLADVRSYGVCLDTVDSVHPSACGMRQLSSMVLAQMGIAKPLIADATPAQRCCSKPSCAGCPYADVTDTSWALGCLKPKV